MKDNYDFNEVVKVISTDPEHLKIVGMLGVVRGKVRDEKTKLWSYGVAIYELDGLIYRLKQTEIKTEGRKELDERFMSGDSMKVKVDFETGKGFIGDKQGRLG